jgi:hypothetical protein
MSFSAVVGEKRTSFTACFRCISCSRFLCSCSAARSHSKGERNIYQVHRRQRLQTNMQLCGLCDAAKKLQLARSTLRTASHWYKHATDMLY